MLLGDDDLVQAAIWQLIMLKNKPRKRRKISEQTKELKQEAFELILKAVRTLPREDLERLKELLKATPDKKLDLKAFFSEKEGEKKITLYWYS